MLVGKLLNLATVSALFAGATTTFAEGFRNSTIGASDLGRSGGRIAQVDDATAVQHNPANMLNVTNAQAEFTPTVLYFKVDYTSLDGRQSASTIHPWKALPNIFATMPLIDDRLAVGLGITVPYGLASEWNTADSAFSPPTLNNWFANSAYYSQLITVNVNPSVAVKVNEKLRLGFGLDVMWSQLEFRRHLSPVPSVLYADAKGSGVGVGGNFGLTWLITEKQSLALTYRSTMTVDYSGDTDFYNIPGLGSFSTSFNSQIKFPNIIAAGYGIQLTDAVRMEADFEWLQFSQFKNLPINIGANPLGDLSQTISEKWHNSFTAGLGADWRIDDHWVLRGGYQYFKTPVPDSTLTPTIPDANQNVITAGVGWNGKHNSFEFAYGLDFYNKRDIYDNQNSAFNGKYSFNVHLFSAAYHYSF